MNDMPETFTIMLTEASASGQLEVFFEKRPMPLPRDHEVLVKVQATPINPSDLGLLFGPVDVSEATAGERNDMPSLVMPIFDAALRAMQGTDRSGFPHR